MKMNQGSKLIRLTVRKQLSVITAATWRRCATAHGKVNWSSGREGNQTKPPPSKTHTRMLKLQLHVQAEALGPQKDQKPT